MFDFIRKNKKKEPGLSWAGRLKQGLSKTRTQILSGFDDFLYGRKVIDDTLFNALEAQLLQSDMGVSTTHAILEALRQAAGRGELDSKAALEQLLIDQLMEAIEGAQSPMPVDQGKPYVILMVGVNGAGKTTTIAKMAHYYQQQGKKILLAAGDTFRAAAVEQLQVWGERNEVPVIAQHDGADSAAVIFDAMDAACARDVDILFADTAGRLHTQDALMDELKKIKRVMKKRNDQAPHETMLIIDASMGQNALQQAKLFHEHLGVDSIGLTKLDGTAKGGIVFSIYQTLKLPIRFIGAGEGLTDLQPFCARTFVEALLDVTHPVKES